jgi:hypothetical protein
MCYAMIDPARVRTMVLFREQHHPIRYRYISMTADAQCSEGLEQAKVKNELLLFPFMVLMRALIEKSIHRTGELCPRTDMY